MAFVKNDPRINRQGRAKNTEKPTRRQQKEQELSMLLRKIKPHITDAILKAAAIMNNAEASHLNQLKAATILLDNYRKLAIDIAEDPEEVSNDDNAEKENQPVFSLKMVK